jgi:hypothetical protein
MVYLLTYLRRYEKDESSQEKDRRLSGWQLAGPERYPQRHARLQPDRDSHEIELPQTQRGKRRVGGVEEMLYRMRTFREQGESTQGEGSINDPKNPTAAEPKRIVNEDRVSGDLGTNAFSVESKHGSHQTTDQLGDLSEQLDDGGRMDDAAGHFVDEHRSTSSLVR